MVRYSAGPVALAGRPHKEATFLLVRERRHSPPAPVTEWVTPGEGAEETGNAAQEAPAKKRMPRNFGGG